MYSLLFFPIDWFVDYEPPWLGTAVMIFGIICVAASYIRTVSVQNPARYYVIIFPLAGLGVAPWVLTYPEPFVIIFTFTGNWLQGVGIVRGSLKIKSYLNTAWNVVFGNSSSDRSGYSKVVQKVGVFLMFQLAGVLALVVSVWVGFGLTTYEVLTIPSLTTDIVITWTLLTLFGSILGLSWRFWSVRDTLPGLLLFGLILLAGGAELRNLRFGSDVLIFFLNKTVLGLGFISSVAVLAIKSRSNTKSSATWRGQA
jgi:hypothetical protein